MKRENNNRITTLQHNNRSLNILKTHNNLIGGSDETERKTIISEDEPGVIADLPPEELEPERETILSQEQVIDDLPQEEESKVISQEDKMDLVKIVEKISPNQINDFISGKSGIFSDTGNIPSIDELSAKMFDGFLTARLKDTTKWEQKCNFKEQKCNFKKKKSPSSNIEDEYLKFLKEVDQLDEEDSQNSTASRTESSTEKKSFFSRIASNFSRKKGGGEETGQVDDAEGDAEGNDEGNDEGEKPPVEQKGFMGHFKDVENFFIDKWKGVDLYEIFDELKPKPLIKAVKNPKFILSKNTPVRDGDKDDICGEEWNLILDHLCQIRIRSQIIYLESLKTVNPDFESDYEPELLTQQHFEYHPQDNPNGFKLDDNIHYSHEPEPLTQEQKAKNKKERNKRRRKRKIAATKRLISEKLGNIKKTLKRKAGEAGRAVTSVSLPSVTMPGMSFSSEHDKKLDKHLEFRVANTLINGINNQSEIMAKNTQRGRDLARQSQPSLSRGSKKTPPELNLAQKVAAHGFYGGEDNFRNVQRRFNSRTGKAYGKYIGIT